MSLLSGLVGLSSAPQFCLLNSSLPCAAGKKKIRRENNSGLSLRYLWS